VAFAVDAPDGIGMLYRVLTHDTETSLDIPGLQNVQKPLCGLVVTIWPIVKSEDDLIVTQANTVLVLNNRE
jgi:hypothetical protein